MQVVLEESGKDDGMISGVYGMVADLIKVDTAYVPAIEAVLGDRAQIVVTNSIKEVIQASGFLKEQDKGYVKFLPLEDISMEGVHASVDLNAPGVVGRAVDLIKSEDSYKALVEYIFRDTIVVEDFDTALKLSGDKCGAKCIVTLNGEVVEPGGSILVGKGNMKIGLISRKTELESTKLELAKILEEVKTRLSERELKESEVVHLVQNADEFKSGIDAENVIKVSQENNLQKEEFKNVELNDEREVNESEIQEINEHIESINQRETSLNSEIAALNDQRKVLEEQVVSFR